MAKTVLVVDDDPVVRRLLQQCLKRAGYQMTTANSGHAAVEVATRELPRLIIMDVMMPEMSGLEALRLLRTIEATKEIPVIVLTANAHRVTHLESDASGAAVFLTKPVTKSELLAVVRRLIPDIP